MLAETRIWAANLNAEGFWDMPFDDGQRGLDGAQWTLAAIHEGRTHVVQRWSPERGAFYALCLQLVDAVGCAEFPDY